MTDERREHDRKPRDRPYRERRNDHDGSDRGRERGHGFRGRDRNDNGRRGFRPHDRDQSDGDRKDFKPRDRGFGDRRDRPYHKDRGHDDRRRPRDGDGLRREFKPRDREDRGPRDRRQHRDGDRPRREYRPRDRDGYGSRDPSRDRRPRTFDRPSDGQSERTQVCEEKRFKLPSDPQKLLFRGVDCQANGKDDLAMIMYLHGAVLMSKGCENNALSMLRNIGKDGFLEKRSVIEDRCSEDALVEYDYLCYSLDKAYDRSFLDSRYSDGNRHAIYCRVRMEEVDGEDPIIDVFASDCGDDDAKVIDGLKLLKRKKDSLKAADNLQRFEDNKRLRQSVHTSFAHAMKGNQSAVKDLERLSSRFPEAAFFLEYMDNRSKGTEMEWLKEKYPQFKELIISEEYHLNIKDTPFGLFLRAKNLQAKKEDWIPQMVKAAKAGSDEALDELIPLMYRPDIKRSVAEVYLARMDLDGLLSLYFDGFEDTMYLEKFCQSDRSLILKVGSRLGEKDVEKEMDWYRVNARNGYTECRNELINRMHDRRYRSKAMIYALHDSGADMEAARLYFELEMEGNDSLPSVKWLRKVCDTDAVKDFVHDHYEEKDDLATFESIFTDDGYRKKSFGRRPFKKKGDKRRR